LRSHIIGPSRAILSQCGKINRGTIEALDCG
jgi:hypothetical protein